MVQIAPGAAAAAERLAGGGNQDGTSTVVAILTAVKLAPNGRGA